VYNNISWKLTSWSPFGTGEEKTTASKGRHQELISLILPPLPIAVI